MTAQITEANWAERWTAYATVGIALFTIMLVAATIWVRIIAARLSFDKNLRISRSFWPGENRFYFHLLVKNNHPFTAAIRCKVELRKITKKCQPRNGKEWCPDFIPHNLPFQWAPGDKEERFGRTFMDESHF